MDLATVKHTVRLSSDVSFGCPYCQKWQDGEDMDTNINHYLTEHAAAILHLGGEAYNDEGTTAHRTVALLGFTDLPPPIAPAKVVIERH